MSYDYLFKYILIGNTAVGKTSYTDRLIQNEFHYHHDSTIGVDFRCKTLTMDHNTVIKTHMWDTAGQEKFSSIIRSYYNGIAGAIMIFDVGSRNSFQQLNYWKKEMIENRNSTDPLIVMILGNKVDRKYRAVSRKEAEDYVKQCQNSEDNIHYLYAETSCKDNKNIQESFEWLVNETYVRMDKENPGCGIKRSIPYQDSIVIKSRGKPRECYYISDECRNKCCVIL